MGEFYLDFDQDRDEWVVSKDWEEYARYPTHREAKDAVDLLNRNLSWWELQKEWRDQKFRSLDFHHGPGVGSAWIQENLPRD